MCQRVLHFDQTLSLSLSTPLTHNMVGCFVVVVVVAVAIVNANAAAAVNVYSLNSVDPTTKLEKLFTNRLPRERFPLSIYLLSPFELVYCGIFLGGRWGRYIGKHSAITVF